MRFEFLSKGDKKTIYNLKKDTLRIVSGMIAVLSFAAIFVYAFLLKFTDTIIYGNLVLCCCICLMIMFTVNRIDNHRLLSILLVLYLEFLFLPIIILYGAEAAASTPVFFAAGIMVMMAVLRMKDFWWTFILVFYWNTFLYTKTYLWSNKSAVIENRVSYFWGYAISFVAVAVALNFVLLMIEKDFTIAEKEIDASHETEKNAGLAKARFLANMSHEIRTPMNSIIGLSELVLKEEMDDITRNELNVIKNSAFDLLEIIDDVLMYSKLDSGKVKLVNVDFRFDELLKQVLNSISSNMGKKDLKVRVKIDHNIPKVLNGDDMRIKQIFMRLVFISLSLTDNGRLMISIDCKRDVKNEKASFTCRVSDTGCGLSQYDLDAIYGAYDTYDSRQNSNLKGIGLKFCICRELLDLMGGTMEIRSIDGVGLESEFHFDCDITNPEPMISVEEGEKKNVLIYINDNREYNTWKGIMEGFKIRPDYVNSYFSFDKAVKNKKYDYIFIPNETFVSVENIISSYNTYEYTYIVANSNQSFGDFGKCRIVRHPVSSLSIVDVLNNQWKAEDYILNRETVDYDGSGAKILVVDDNGVNLKVAAGIFKAYNIDIDMAKSGEEALKKLEANDYHMVLMDMVMPEMSGEETLKRMRMSVKASTREVAVVALTANTGANIREEILEKGFQEYLSKPIKLRYLTQCLLAFLPPGMLKQKSADNKQDKKKPVEKPKKILVDYKAGLEAMGGSEETYNLVLNTFVTENSAKLERLDEMAKAEDLNLFTTTVHGMKSSLASIGAKESSELFKELEFAGKDNKRDVIDTRLENAKHVMADVLDEIRKHLGKEDSAKQEEPANENASEEVPVKSEVSLDDKKVKEEASDNSKDAEIEAFRNDFALPFKEAVETMNIELCTSLLASIEGKSFGNPIDESLKDVREAFELFDFKKLNDVSSMISKQ